MHYQAARILCNSSFALTIFGVVNSTVQQKWQKRSQGFHWMCPNSGIASSKGRKDRDAQRFLAVKLDALLLSPSNHYHVSWTSTFDRNGENLCSISFFFTLMEKIMMYLLLNEHDI